MTKLQMTELHKLSVKDKIKVVQTLWDDIAEEQAIDTLSADHKKDLEERLKKIESGEAQFIPWSDIQAKFKGI
jgi:putative addiction module component (TIGR02574 family)